MAEGLGSDGLGRTTTRSHGIDITVVPEDDRYDAYFTNAPGNFENLHHVKASRGHPSREGAIAVAVRYVESHQWREVSSLGVFTLFVRHWWDETWGYSVRCGGSMNSDSGYPHEQAARYAGIAKMREMHEELERQMAEAQERLKAAEPKV